MKTNIQNKPIIIRQIETDVGWMLASASDQGICMFDFIDYKSIKLELKQLERTFKAPLIEGNHPFLDILETQIAEYFRKERQEFDIPLDLVGTEFQKKVWLSLLEIPYGKTISYLQQAQSIGSPTAVRAVANANGKNKIAIILPCHRVLGSDGSLTGYGGGVWRKKKLLELEQTGNLLF